MTHTEKFTASKINNQTASKLIIDTLKTEFVGKEIAYPVSDDIPMYRILDHVEIYPEKMKRFPLRYNDENLETFLKENVAYGIIVDVIESEKASEYHVMYNIEFVLENGETLTVF